VSDAETLLHANIGVEAARDPSPAARRVLARLAELWAMLFTAGARIAGADRPPAWPCDLGDEPRAPAWPFLAGVTATAWLHDSAAAHALGDRAANAVAPAVVAHVHDKAFALAAARRLRLNPDLLDPLLSAFEPRELTAPDRRERLRDRLASWPDWTGGRFLLKPRWGTSGRGRVAGQRRHLDAISDRAFSRLAHAAGAILEPALDRTADLSVQMWLDGADATIVGTTRQLVSEQGEWLGNVGHLTDQGRSVSGDPADHELVSAARAIAVELAAAGYHGPCGVDSFRFVGPDDAEILRPVVELNARWTTGLVALGLLERARSAGRTDGAAAWCFTETSPPGPWQVARCEPQIRILALAPGETGPALVLASDADLLQRVVLRALAGRGVR